MTESAALLSCSGVEFAYRREPTLQDVNLEIRRGEWIGIIGPNGAGKSTLLNLLVGVLQPVRGQVLLEGEPLRMLAPDAVARRLAVVPQAAPLVFGHRVADVIAMGRHPHQSALQWKLSEVDALRVVWAMERTGTARLASRRFNQLSGGEQQLVYIARALAQSTEVLLLDEPTASLDLHHQAQVIEVLRGLHAEGSTIIWIAHDLNLVGRVCQRLILLELGRIHAEGSPEQILTRERLSAVYETDVDVDVAPDGHRRVELAFESGRA